MAIKQFFIDSQNLSVSRHCRLDQKYTAFTQVNNWIVFESKYEQGKLSGFLSELPIIKVGKGELENEAFLVNISDQLQKSGQLSDVETTTLVGSDKTYLGDADIFVSKLGMPKGYIFVNTFKNQNILGSTEFIPYNFVDEKNSKYLQYILLHKKLLLAYAALESGKTPSHRRVNPYEFLNIKIPILPLNAQNRIIASIEPLETTIKELRARIIPPHKIINKVFTRDFKFDLPKFEELKKIKYSSLDFLAFSNNRDIRQSVKFHREAGRFVIKDLMKNGSKRMKNFLSEPIILGAGISPKQYDEDGDFFYISMANIKNWRFETDEAKLVSKVYSAKNQNKLVSENDIILARSGEGTIGKVAIIEEEDVQGIFCDFTMRIRFANYNPLFAYFYFRTEYFQYLIEINKKGLGNNTNIFPSQMQELPMLDIPLPRQQEIVEEIQGELATQDTLIQRIDSERNKIDEIIENEIALRKAS